MLRQRIQGRHKRISLLAALPLTSLMGVARVVEPRVRCWWFRRTAERGEQRLEKWPRKKRAEHSVASAQNAADGLGASAHAKTELVGQACF